MISHASFGCCSLTAVWANGKCVFFSVALFFVDANYDKIIEILQNLLFGLCGDHSFGI